DVRQSSYAALGLSLVLTALRLARKETIQHAISGVIGVAICAWLSNRTGKAEDFYLPGLWTNAIYGAVYLVSILVRWPIIGLIIGPLLEENLRWRKDPVRTKVYMKATALWVLYEGNRSMGRHVCGPTPSSISALYLRKCQCTRNSAFDYGLPALYRRSVGHMDRN
ncbi:MAG: hypothetical protein RL155_296, partial [Actinomycetota bacterium]